MYAIQLFEYGYKYNYLNFHDFCIVLVSPLIFIIFVIQFYKWRAQFQNQINPLLMKILFLTSLYKITLELVTEWNLDPDNLRKYIFFLI